MTPAEALKAALDKFDGSPTRLAEAVKGDVKRQNVEYWIRKGRVPAEHAPAVERETGIACELLCPGPDWSVLRAQAA